MKFGLNLSKFDFIIIIYCMFIYIKQYKQFYPFTFRIFKIYSVCFKRQGY